MNKESFIPNPERCAVCPDRSNATRIVIKLTGNAGYVAPSCAELGGPEEKSYTFIATGNTYTRIKCALPFDLREAYTDGCQ